MAASGARSRGRAGNGLTSTARRWLVCAAGCTLTMVCSIVALPGAAHAQLSPFGLGGGTPGPGAPPGKPGAAPPSTHAATGGDNGTTLPKTDLPLPEDPTAIPDAVKKRIGTDADLDLDKGIAKKPEVDFYGLYVATKDGDYEFKTVFPFWARRKQPGNDVANLYSPFYYQRRSDRVDVDMAFPLFYKSRVEKENSLVVGPFFHQEEPAHDGKPATHANWFFPFAMEAKTSDGGGYFHVPPLLLFTQHSDRDGFDLIGPMFCSWRGGPACDVRTTDDIDLGVAPFYFYGRDRDSEYELIPPLLHYYRWNDVSDHELNVWGPFLWERSRQSNAFNIMPLYWHNWGKDEDHLTLFPLFHVGHKGDSSLLATPLFVHGTGDNGETGFGTYVFGRYRGRTEYDMWTPLFHWYRDPDVGRDTKLFLPFVYRTTSPRSDDIAVFPFFAHFERFGVSEETWITPIFRHQTSLTGWETDLNPIFYMGTENASTHLVVAPILWDFASPKSRQTVVAPIFWRFASRDSVSQLALNTYYHETRVRSGKDWEFHFFPLFSYGESPDGHWWNVLYGLTGYTREGTASKMRLLYIPIKTSE